jgi:hypothetical protein
LGRVILTKDVRFAWRKTSSIARTKDSNGWTRTNVLNVEALKYLKKQIVKKELLDIASHVSLRTYPIRISEQLKDGKN